MAEKKKKGLMTRLIEGTEKSESYARSTLPTNRWELFWDILKGRLGKLFIINLLVLIFLIPLFLLFLVHSNFLSLQAASQPFAQNILTGYPTVPDIAGVAESVTLNVNRLVFALVPIAALIFSLGLAGGFYVIRNMVWTEGIFVANDFWRGIKLNYFTMLKISIFYTAILFFSIYSLSAIDLMLIRTNFPSWLLYIAKGSSYILLIIITLMTFFMFTMGVTYELSFFKLLKNSFLLTIGLLPTNLLFALAAALPLIILMLGGFFMQIGIILLMMIGISFLMLVWTNYSHWIFDKYVNEKVEGAVINRGIYEKVAKGDSSAVMQYKRQLEQAAKSQLASRPIKPITDKEISLAELPQNYSRRHLELLKESKERIVSDHDEYVEKHKSLPKYLEAQKLAEEQDSQDEQPPDTKQKKGKKSSEKQS